MHSLQGTVAHTFSLTYNILVPFRKTPSFDVNTSSDGKFTLACYGLVAKARLWEVGVLPSNPSFATNLQYNFEQITISISPKEELGGLMSYL